MTSRAYYNEIDKYAAQWLRNLIDAGLIAPGDVDERDIRDVKPSELDGYTQCHFFAGIGGWSYALRLAGWPDDRPVWTGSCPCQPFSAAGAGAGFADERHLWPHWFHLIGQSRPPVIFGEQVASKNAEPWLDLVQADLEALVYTFGAVPFPAASVGAPHIRDRLYWVADSDSKRCGRKHALLRQRGQNEDSIEVARSGKANERGNTSGARGRRNARAILGKKGESQSEWLAARRIPNELIASSPTRGFWRDADWLYCRDGKWRPVEPGTFPLVDGSAFKLGSGSALEGKSRVGMLRAYGNAIVPPIAAAFIAAAMETVDAANR